MEPRPLPIRGRGAAANPPNRFERLRIERDPDAALDEQPAPRTEFYRDSSRSVINHNDSPDIPFECSLNPYRGCEHGCIYCFARCTHEFLGFSAGLDFETKILVKEDAPELLAKELSSRRWTPKPISLGTATDPYQPIERKLQLTRRCLQVLAEFRNPVTLITKNHLVTRDIDLLSEMARRHLVAVLVSVTSLDAELVRILEPRTSSPQRRLAAIQALSAAGIPVGVMVSPIIPGLTDHEIPAIVSAAAQAGATSAGLQIVRLPGAVAGLFEQWLEQHRPERKQKVLHRLQAMRGGKLNETPFGKRMRTTGEMAEQIHAIFDLACRKAKLGSEGPELSTAEFRRSDGGQMSLFE